MTSRDFCYWLQGAIEINPNATASLNEAQVTTIKNHLAMVFQHEIDPSHGDKKHQAELTRIHQGVTGLLGDVLFTDPPKMNC